MNAAVASLKLGAEYTVMDMCSTIVLGIFIVFAVLAIIYLMMVCMKLVFYKEPKPVAAPVVATPVAAPVVENATDAEIAAVILTIAAALETDPSNIRLTSLTGLTQKITNTVGGNYNEKLYRKDRWKDL